MCESVPEDKSDSRTETITCPVPRVRPGAQTHDHTEKHQTNSYSQSRPELSLNYHVRPMHVLFSLTPYYK